VTINVPKPDALRAGMANIQANLSYWSQDVWVTSHPDTPVPQDNHCGTTACLAGHIVLAAGHSWDDIFHMNIAFEAMKLLGYELVRVPRWCHGCDQNHMEDHWSGDGDEFTDIFYHMSFGDGLYLEYSQEAFDAFKAYVTEVTGVEL
jgi:hypothetical protein